MIRSSLHIHLNMTGRFVLIPRQWSFNNFLVKLKSTTKTESFKIKHLTQCSTKIY